MEMNSSLGGESPDHFNSGLFENGTGTALPPGRSDSDFGISMGEAGNGNTDANIPAPEKPISPDSGCINTPMTDAPEDVENVQPSNDEQAQPAAAIAQVPAPTTTSVSPPRPFQAPMTTLAPQRDNWQPNLDNFPLPTLYLRPAPRPTDPSLVESAEQWRNRLLGGPSTLTIMRREREEADRHRDGGDSPSGGNGGNGGGGSGPSGPEDPSDGGGKAEPKGKKDDDSDEKAFDPATNGESTGEMREVNEGKTDGDHTGSPASPPDLNTQAQTQQQQPNISSSELNFSPLQTPTAPDLQEDEPMARPDATEQGGDAGKQEEKADDGGDELSKLHEELFDLAVGSDNDEPYGSQASSRRSSNTLPAEDGDDKESSGNEEDSDDEEDSNEEEDNVPKRRYKSDKYAPSESSTGSESMLFKRIFTGYRPMTPKIQLYETEKIVNNPDYWQGKKRGVRKLETLYGLGNVSWRGVNMHLYREAKEKNDWREFHEAQEDNPWFDPFAPYGDTEITLENSDWEEDGLSEEDIDTENDSGSELSKAPSNGDLGTTGVSLAVEDMNDQIRLEAKKTNNNQQAHSDLEARGVALAVEETNNQIRLEAKKNNHKEQAHAPESGRKYQRPRPEPESRVEDDDMDGAPKANAKVLATRKVHVPKSRKAGAVQGQAPTTQPLLKLQTSLQQATLTPSASDLPIKDESPPPSEATRLPKTPETHKTPTIPSTQGNGFTVPQADFQFSMPAPAAILPKTPETHKTPTIPSTEGMGFTVPQAGFQFSMPPPAGISKPQANRSDAHEKVSRVEHGFGKKRQPGDNFSRRPKLGFPSETPRPKCASDYPEITDEVRKEGEKFGITKKRELRELPAQMAKKKESAGAPKAQNGRAPRRRQGENASTLTKPNCVQQLDASLQAKNPALAAHIAEKTDQEFSANSTTASAIASNVPSPPKIPVPPAVSLTVPTYTLRHPALPKNPLSSVASPVEEYHPTMPAAGLNPSPTRSNPIRGPTSAPPPVPETIANRGGDAVDTGIGGRSEARRDSTPSTFG
ncbi:hypothetical protein BDW02DRAFT_648002 [Decorospora gaudefroyi]|uniref:Uncharacterized protein n=1 Tax=Decorospora gaudefroyi TaxID=184978 RepID=A0A6A5KBW7_9PLEO|nr:hypothetical protein BDW02DRAFT_648002 [Decorospora gaudefroyi]